MKFCVKTNSKEKNDKTNKMDPDLDPENGTLNMIGIKSNKIKINSLDL